MRDRTIILWALLFLVLSVGAGVDRSLAAGNKMLGRQMAPGVEQLYQQQAPLVLGEAREIAAYGKAKTLAVSRQYPVLAREVKTLNERIQQQLAAVVSHWREKLPEIVQRVDEEITSEKNRTIP